MLKHKHQNNFNAIALKLSIFDFYGNVTALDKIEQQIEKNNYSSSQFHNFRTIY